MTKITRYFLTEFLRPLFLSFGALAVLVMVSELLERMDKFIAGKAGAALVAQYLVATLPIRTVELFPIAALLAALFSLGNLSRRQEITAAMSGGIHPWKCAQPLLLCGMVLSLFSWGLSEWVVPPASRRARRLWNDRIRHLTSPRQTQFDNLTVAGENGTLYSIRRLDTVGGTMENIVVDRTAGGRPAGQVQAKSAQWEDGWVFREGVERTYGPDGVSLGRQESFTERRVDLPERPQDLVPQDPDTDEMNYKQLKRHLRRLKILGIPTRRLEVELHVKAAFPWANIIVLLLGIPFAFRKAGGKVKAVGFALGVAFFYFGLLQVGRALGQKPWCPPLLGAWLANGVFLAAGGWLFLRMRKLS